VGLIIVSSFLPRHTGEGREGAGHRFGAASLQIMMIFSRERPSLRFSPSCILPRKTGEEMRKR